MNRRLFAITASVVLTAAGLMAQNGDTVVRGTAGAGTFTFVSDQQADSLGTDTVIVGDRGGRGGRGGQGVTGSPVSAREETRTVQTLGDGTQIESSNVSQFYRDNQGRTRTERTVDGKTIINIVDPVAGTRITLDPAAKTATRITMITGAARGGRGGGGQVTSLIFSAPSGTVVPGILMSVPAKRVCDTPSGCGPQSNRQVKNEDLGLQMTNGVMAEGTRVTNTIPVGTIGNNRDIHEVNERWYSKDLQMMVKTINSDPRFGTTTYEMTNISQAAPDAGLFMIPAGYAVTEQAGRGGRGAALTPAAGGGR